MRDRSRIPTPAANAAPDPRDLPGDFAHRVVIDVRFADTDAMGHVNNAVYLTYCEMARIRYWTDVTGEPIAPGHEGAESLILAEARITYRAPVFHGERVTVRGQVACMPAAGPGSGYRDGGKELVMKPGATARPFAWSTRVAVAFDKSPIAAMTSPRTPTSARRGRAPLPS